MMGLWSLAAPLHAQTATATATKVTIDRDQSILELVGGGSLQLPPDVNSWPTCQDLGLPCLSAQTAPNFGIAGSTALFITDAVGLVVEGSVYANTWYASGTICTPGGGGRPATCPMMRTNYVRSALGGVRVRGPLMEPGATRLRLFGQLLAGPQWTDVGPRKSVIQPGVGLEDYLGNGLAIHFELDYRIAEADRRDFTTSRFFVGIAVPLGSR